MPPDSGADDVGDVGDAHHAIEQISGWVSNADVKAELLAAGVAAMLAGAVAYGHLDEAFSAEGREWFAVIALVGFVLALGVTVVMIGCALLPRTVTSERSRFAWPSLAEMADDELAARELDRRTVADEAWLQARTLARIAKVKYAAVRGALAWFGIAVAAFVVWVAASAASF